MLGCQSAKTSKSGRVVWVLCRVLVNLMGVTRAMVQNEGEKEKKMEEKPE